MIASCVMVKNEERYLAEWIAFQFAVGFDAVVVLDNNSTDRTVHLARSAGCILDVRSLEWAYSGLDSQRLGYEHVCREFGREFDWIAFTDVDEFIVPANGGSIDDIVARGASHSAIAVNWLIFGSSGHDAAPSGLVLENFTRRGAVDFPLWEGGDVPNTHVKSIVRPGAVRHCINPHAFAVEGAYVDGSGEPIAWGRDVGITQDVRSGAPCFVHHYYVRSHEEWLRKLQRGYPDGTVRDTAAFALYDRNDVTDLSAIAFVAETKRIMSTFGG